MTSEDVQVLDEIANSADDPRLSLNAFWIESASCAFVMISPNAPNENAATGMCKMVKLSLGWEVFVSSLLAL